MADDKLSIGDRVEILSGNFQGFSGSVIDLAEAQRVPQLPINPSDSPDGLWLKVNIFGRDVVLPQKEWRGMVRKLSN